MVSTVLRQPLPNVLKGEDFPDVAAYEIEGRVITIVKIITQKIREKMVFA